MTKKFGSVGLDDDLGLKIGAGTVTEVLVILPGKAIRTAVNTTAVAIDRVAPTAFPIGGERLGDHLFGRGLFENLELGRRRFADVLSRVPVVGIRRIGDLSHTCNVSLSEPHKQT